MSENNMNIGYSSGIYLVGGESLRLNYAYICFPPKIDFRQLNSFAPSNKSHVPMRVEPIAKFCKCILWK